MKEQEIAKLALKSKGITQEECGKKLGKAYTTINYTLNREGKSMRVKTFADILSVAGLLIEVIDEDGNSFASVNPYSPGDVIRLAMQTRGVTFDKLAKLAGYKYSAEINNFINRSASMQVANLARMLGAMRYKVIVVDKISGEVFAEIDVPSGGQKNTL